MKILKRDNSGQALLEMAFVVPMLLVFVFGLVDFTRAMYDLEVITNLAGEGSSQASRNTTLTNTVAAVMSDADINMTSNGCVIVTSVNNPTAPSGSPIVTAQVSSAPCNGGTSKIGSCNPVGGVCTGSASLPTWLPAVLDASPNFTIYVTEVTYNFAPITPIGAFLHKSNWLPNQLYRAAYY